MPVYYFNWSILLMLAITSVAMGGDTYGTTLANPGKSCRDIYYRNPATHDKSGSSYVIMTDQLHIVSCDMEMECGGEKGWMKVADVNPAGGDACPNGWKNVVNPSACRAPSDNAGCYSAHFSIPYKVPYSRVCGMVVGYQKSTTDGFAALAGIKYVDGPYLDGVSITYGTVRKHIWSYAAGFSDTGDFSSNCPCATRSGALPPSFVQNNYYCESGHDLLWDGDGCSSTNSCCAQPSLPWFYRQIPLTSDKYLEARICRDQAFSDEGVLVKEMKLYVQ